MIYYDNLEDIVFSRHKEVSADELIVLSGYVGPVPVMQLSDISGLRSQVVYGMFNADGIRPNFHKIMKEVTINSDATKVLYADIPVHSKCYVWRKNGIIRSALIGSANFTTCGLTTPYREILSDVQNDSFKVLNDYLDDVFGKSKLCTFYSDENCSRQQFSPSIEYLNQQLKESLCEMPLYNTRENEVPGMSGLNWCLANGNVSEGDGYITITAGLIRDYPSMFPPKQEYSTVVFAHSKSSRKNDPVEIIWDDGTVMKGLLEGTQTINGIDYPNKISSFPRKSILGKYLRKRMGVAVDHRITLDDLNKYGRNSIGVSLIGDGVYEMDFSPKK